MANYTIYLQELINSNWDLGLKNYPIFDETYREKLNKKIIDHFRFREIGAETPALFIFYLNRLMDEIMPYYNQLYKSTLLEIDPLNPMGYSEVMEHTTIGEGETTGSDVGITSDTPQQMITGGDLDSGVYASAASQATSKNVQKATTTDNYKKSIFGKNGNKSQSELLEDFRKTFLNIDRMIINEIDICFLQIAQRGGKK